MTPGLPLRFRGGVVAFSGFGSTLADVASEPFLKRLACRHGSRIRAAKILDISICCRRMTWQDFGQGRLRSPGENGPIPDIGRSVLCNSENAVRSTP
jgi:hypothetical protein